MILTNYFHSMCTHDGAKNLTIISIKCGWLSIKTETNLANWPKSNQYAHIFSKYRVPSIRCRGYYFSLFVGNIVRPDRCWWQPLSPAVSYKNESQNTSYLRDCSMSIGSTISMRVCAPHILATATSRTSRLCSYYNYEGGDYSRAASNRNICTKHPTLQILHPESREDVHFHQTHWQSPSGSPKGQVGVY